MKLLTKLNLTLCLAAVTGCACAFDDDIAINDPDFKNENFLDIKAYQFRQSLRQQWYDTENGLSITGGSLGENILTIQSELLLKHSLSDSVDIRLQHQEDSFYGIKPYARPLFEVAAHPWQIPLELSFLGYPTYDKRQSDMGFAISFGLRPRNYLRITWLEQDFYYNEKNEFDASSYQQPPRVLGIEGDYSVTKKLRTRFSWRYSKPLTLVDTDENLFFEHQSKQIDLVLDYFYKNDALVGISYRGFEIDKALQDTQQDRSQVLGFDSIDFYWAHFFTTGDEITLGTQFDAFENQLRDVSSPNEHFNYTFSTWQVYSTYYHKYSSHTAWELGIYIGDVKARRDYLQAGRTDRQKDSVEAKLRTSWEYHSLEGHGTIILHLGFNLDNLSNDPGDGGGISYQVAF